MWRRPRWKGNPKKELQRLVRLTLTNLNPLLAQQLYPQTIGKVNGNEVKQKLLSVQQDRIQWKGARWPLKKATKLLTFTAARMLHGKVQSIETNFLFKQTFVVVCCAIGWTYGFFVSWTAVQTHTACIIRSKSLTQTVIMTCYIYTRIQV